MKKELEENHLERSLFSCQIHLSKVQVDDYLYHLTSVSRKHSELVKPWSICLTMKKTFFLCFHSIVVLYN
jgi:hypothetical protein